MKDARDMETVTNAAAERLAAGDAMEDVLAFLRAQGCQVIETIKILSSATGVSRAEAKRLVHTSRAWGHLRSAHDRFHDAVERVASEEGD